MRRASSKPRATSPRRCWPRGGLGGPVDRARPGKSYEVIGNVGFAGEANGIAYLCFTDGFAVHAAGLMAGMSRGEVAMNGPDAAKDAIGEITNMTAGGFKNQFCDIGFPGKLTLPAIVRGRNLIVAAIKAAHRHVFEITCDGHDFVADIPLKTELFRVVGPGPGEGIFSGADAGRPGPRGDARENIASLP